MTSWTNGLLLSVLAPVFAAVLVYRFDAFEPALLPTHEFARRPVFVPSRNPNMLRGAEKVGAGKLMAPEDLAYDAELGLLYTGCADGWIKRVTVNDSEVEDWINTGGRPLGVVLGLNKELIIADADKGLLKVNEKKEMELLTDEAEGLKFKLTDGVDVTEEGVVYFTDASYKYSLAEFVWDILEGRPYGRLLSYDPSTKQTHVLLRDLYFPNGVALSPDRNFLVFCETQMRRCRKYNIKGERKGMIDKFVDDLPGMPDNIRYDGGQDLYWIALATEATFAWDLAQRSPFIRKIVAIIEKYVGRPHMEKNSGVLAVDIEGKPLALYCDPGLALMSTGIKIGDHLYCGSVIYPYILRLNLTQYPALASM